nr:hypothetical protein B0A51_03570 [Rachicladosporium sp. CCFEE 5018]
MRDRRILHAPTPQDWISWRPIIESRYKTVTNNMFVDEMSDAGLLVSVKMIADRKRKWGINDKNRRKNQEANQTAETVLPEKGSSSIRPIVLADDSIGNDITTPTAPVSSSMHLTTPVREASLSRSMDLPAPPAPAKDPASPSPSPMPLLDLSITARAKLSTMDEDDDSESADHLVTFPVNSLIPSSLVHAGSPEGMGTF